MEGSVLKNFGYSPKSCWAAGTDSSHQKTRVRLKIPPRIGAVSRSVHLALRIDSRRPIMRPMATDGKGKEKSFWESLAASIEPVPEPKPGPSPQLDTQKTKGFVKAFR